MGEIDRISRGTQELTGFKRRTLRDREGVQVGKIKPFTRRTLRGITAIAEPELQPQIEAIEPTQLGDVQREIGGEMITFPEPFEPFVAPRPIEIEREVTPLGTIVTTPEGRKVVSDIRYPLIRTLAGLSFGFSDRIPIDSPFEFAEDKDVKDKFKGLTFGDIEAEGLTSLLLGEVGHFIGTIASGVIAFKAIRAPLSYGVGKLANTTLGKAVIGRTNSMLDDLYNAISKSSTLKNPPPEILNKAVNNFLKEAGNTVGIVGTISATNNLSETLSQSENILDFLDKVTDDFGSGAVYGTVFPVSGLVFNNRLLRTFIGMAGLDVMKALGSRPDGQPITSIKDFTTTDEFLGTFGDLFNGDPSDIRVSMARKMFSQQLFGYLLDGFFLSKSKTYRREFNQAKQLFTAKESDQRIREMTRTETDILERQLNEVEQQILRTGKELKVIPENADKLTPEMAEAMSEVSGIRELSDISRFIARNKDQRQQAINALRNLTDQSEQQKAQLLAEVDRLAERRSSEIQDIITEQKEDFIKRLTDKENAEGIKNILAMIIELDRGLQTTLTQPMTTTRSQQTAINRAELSEQIGLEKISNNRMQVQLTDLMRRQTEGVLSDKSGIVRLKETLDESNIRLGNLERKQNTTFNVAESFFDTAPGSDIANFVDKSARITSKKIPKETFETMKKLATQLKEKDSAALITEIDKNISVIEGINRIQQASPESFTTELQTQRNDAMDRMLLIREKQKEVRNILTKDGIDEKIIDRSEELVNEVTTNNEIQNAINDIQAELPETIGDNIIKREIEISDNKPENINPAERQLRNTSENPLTRTERVEAKLNSESRTSETKKASVQTIVGKSDNTATTLRKEKAEINSIDPVKPVEQSASINSPSMTSAVNFVMKFKEDISRNLLDNLNLKDKNKIRNATVTVNDIINGSGIRELKITNAEKTKLGNDIRNELVRIGLLTKQNKIRFNIDSPETKEFLDKIATDTEQANEQGLIEFESFGSAVNEMSKMQVRADNFLSEIKDAEMTLGNSNTPDFNKAVNLEAESLNRFTRSAEEFASRSEEVILGSSKGKKYERSISAIKGTFGRIKEVIERFNNEEGFINTQFIPHVFGRLAGKVQIRVRNETGSKEQQAAESAQQKLDVLETSGDQLKGRLQQVKEVLVRRFIDIAGNAKSLLNKAGRYGEMAVLRREAIGGSSAKTTMQYEKAMKNIYDPLNLSQSVLLPAVIFHRNVITTKNRKPDWTAPADMSKFESISYLSLMKKQHPVDFAITNKAANEYFKIFRNMLDEMRLNELISKDRHRLLREAGAYSPIMFLPEQERAMKALMGDSFLIQPVRDIIKSLEAGNSEQALELDPRGMLGISLGRHNRTLLMNDANKALYNLAIEEPANGIVRVAKTLDKEGQRTQLKQELERPLTKEEKTVEREQVRKRVRDELLTKPESELPGAGESALRAFIDGQEQRLIVNNEFAAEWATTDPLMQPQFQQWISFISGTSLLKTWATGINPLFGLRNLFYDFGLTYLTKNEHSIYVNNFVREMAVDLKETFRDAKNKTGLYIDYINNGGGMEWLAAAGITKGRPFIPRKSKTGIEAEVDVVINNQMGKFRTAVSGFNNFSEVWTRLAIMNRAQKNGKDPFEAAMIARNMLDFSQGGDWAKAIDSFIPYFNVAIQGTRKIVQAAQKNPKIFGAKVAQLFTVSSLFYLANRFSNPDAWNDTSDNDKLRNFIITSPFSIDDGGVKSYLHFKIPKSPDQRILDSMVQTIWGIVLGDKPEDLLLGFDDIGKIITEILPLIPSSAFPSLVAMLSYGANKDFYFNREIYKGIDVPSYAELDQNTSGLFKIMGKIAKPFGEIGLPTPSPVRLQYTAERMFSVNNNPVTSFVGGAMREAFQILDPEDEQELSTDILIDVFLTKDRDPKVPLIKQIANSPLGKGLIGFSNPLNKGFEKGQRLQEQVNLQTKDIQDNLRELERRAFNDTTDRTAIQAVNTGYRLAIRENPERRVSLVNNLKEFNFMLNRVDQPADRRFWNLIRGWSDPGVRARMYVDHLEQLDIEQKRRIESQLPGMKGINSRRFRIALRKLR